MIVVIANNESNNEVGASSLQERMMNQWQNLVWFSHVPKSSLLLADSFHTHTNSFIQKSMVNRGACLAIIPSACSQKLQPLHRGIKLKFKVNFFLTLQVEPAKLARPTRYTRVLIQRKRNSTKIKSIIDFKSKGIFWLMD